MLKTRNSRPLLLIHSLITTDTCANQTLSIKWVLVNYRDRNPYHYCICVLFISDDGELDVFEDLLNVQVHVDLERISKRNAVVVCVDVADIGLVFPLRSLIDNYLHVLIEI